MPVVIAPGHGGSTASAGMLTYPFHEGTNLGTWGHVRALRRDARRYRFSATMSMEEGEMALEPGRMEAMRRKTFVTPRPSLVREELRR